MILLIDYFIKEEPKISSCEGKHATSEPTTFQSTDDVTTQVIP